MNPTQQSFDLSQLTGPDIEAIMTGLSELPAKASRATMNKIESQVVAQLQAAQAAMEQAAAEQVSKAEKPAK